MQARPNWIVLRRAISGAGNLCNRDLEVDHYPYVIVFDPMPGEWVVIVTNPSLNTIDVRFQEWILR
ncbi:MAG: hypothetical protein MK085_03125 [Phycisphaerales bacterium]|nr:hypothetical protein [Phycisphaerales bacterium]